MKTKTKHWLFFVCACAWKFSFCIFYILYHFVSCVLYHSVVLTADAVAPENQSSNYQ